jgi:hypothetical protein
MNLYYRLGWPFGFLVASLGVPTVIRIDVIKDAEAGVFVGTSRDLRGLVVEAESLEGVLREARLVIPDLVRKPVANDAVACMRYSDRIAHA